MFYTQFKKGIFSIKEIKEFIMRAKYFRFKLADMAEQLKTIRYTVQRTRNVTTTSSFFMSDAKKTQKFKEAYLKGNLVTKSAKGDVEHDITTQHLFYRRYKQLYLNTKSESQKHFSYR